jgi:hypothetical protein
MAGTANWIRCHRKWQYVDDVNSERRRLYRREASGNSQRLCNWPELLPVSFSRDFEPAAGEAT